MKLPDENAARKYESADDDSSDHGSTNSNTQRQREGRSHSVVEGLVDLFTHYRAFLLSAVAISVLGTIVGYVLSPTVYTARSILSVKTAERTLSDMFMGGGRSSLSKTELAQKYVQLFNSEKFFVQFAQAVKLREDFAQLNLKKSQGLDFSQIEKVAKRIPGLKRKTQREQARDPLLIPVEKLAEKLRDVVFTEIDQNDRINLVAKTLEPNTAMILANVAATEFEKVSLEYDGQDIENIEAFLRQKLVDATDSVKSSELKMVEFKKRYAIMNTRSDSQADSDELKTVEQKLASARLQYEQNEKLLKLYVSQEAASLSRMAKPTGDNADATTIEVDVLRSKLDQLAKQKDLMQAEGFSSQHWRMKAVEEEQAAMASKLKILIDSSGVSDGDLGFSRISRQRALRAENSELQSQIKTLEQRAGSIKEKLRDVPKTEQEFLSFKRQLDIDYETYSQLKKKLEEIQIQKLSIGRKLSIESLAPLPGRAPKSSIVLNILFSIFSGLFLGGVLVFGREFIDPRVKGRDDIEESGLFFLGEIPNLEIVSQREKLGIGTVDSTVLICRHQPESKEAMAFKFVRARILRHPTESVAGSKIGQIITVTSPGPGEGKSFVSANLAISFAQLGKKTVIVDCDFRNPKVASFFEVRSPGLVGLFHDESSLRDIIVKSGDENLDVIPAGVGAINATETISRTEFGQLLNSLSRHYEYVILDSPPVNAVVDAAVLATYSDHTILLSRFRETRRPALLRAHRKVAQLSNSRVYGIVNRSSSIENILLYYGYPYLARTEGSDMKQAKSAKSAPKADFADKLELKVENE